MVEIKSCREVGGRGVFTQRSYQTGEVVLQLTGPIVDQPTRESIELSPNQHIIDPVGSYINHSFTPTTRIDSCLQAVVALADLSLGSHVTFNYNENETQMACPFMAEGKAVVGKSPKAT